MGAAKQSHAYDHRKNSDWLTRLAAELSEKGIDIPHHTKMTLLNRIQFACEYWHDQGAKGVDFEAGYSNKK